MKTKNDPNINPFNQDIISNSGYLYTTNSKLSSYFANRRMTDATLSIIDFHGKKVLDIGCGDGTYTIEVFDLGKPESITAIDPAYEAIEVAKNKINGREIIFAVNSAYELPYKDKSFDIAYIRGVLHHLDRPVDALKEALRVANTTVVIEPNGYNPILKILERVSPYHIKHREKSYAPIKLNQWTKKLGGLVKKYQYIGLVPCFCPDWFAHIMKTIEPAIERIPIINTLGCAQYIFIANRID